MKQYDVKCPICGHVNHNLYLEETEGWMECEKCGSMTVNALLGCHDLALSCCHEIARISVMECSL